MIVYVVYQLKLEWKLIGIFSTEEKADAYAKEKQTFSDPTYVDEWEVQ